MGLSSIHPLCLVEEVAPKIVKKGLLFDCMSSGLELAVLEGVFTQKTVRESQVAIAYSAGVLFQATRAVVVPRFDSSLDIPIEWCRDDSEVAGDDALKIVSYLKQFLSSRRGAVFLEDTRLNPLLAPVRASISAMEISGVVALNTVYENKFNGTIVLFYSEPFQSFSENKKQQLEKFAELSGASLHNSLELRRSEEKRASYSRLVEATELAYFQTNSELTFTYFSEKLGRLLGLRKEDIQSGSLTNFIDKEECQKLKAFASSCNKPESKGKDFYITILAGQQKERLSAKACPILQVDGSHVGWDFFIRPAEKKKVVYDTATNTDSKKIQALYAVSSAIRSTLEPNKMARKGIRAVCDALGAELGVCYVSNGGNELSLFAFHGGRQGARQKLSAYTGKGSINNLVYNSKNAILVKDSLKEKENPTRFFRKEGLRSGIVVPLSVDTTKAVGTLGLFSKSPNHFSEEDIVLVSAAANQIGLATRQAELFASHNKQARKLSALYRISHALSTNMSLDEVLLRSFKIINEEIGVERLWLGLLDETGRNLVGHASYGPGWKNRLVRVNVDITNESNKLTELIAKGTPVRVDNSGQVLEPLGLERVVKSLELQKALFIPLISRGYVLGVLVAQVDKEDLTSLDKEEETLLMSLANELASLLHSRQLEKRIADGERMRAVGVLSSGIAHNFNNILQVVQAQASLLELKGYNEPHVKKAVGSIKEAAGKGATLVEKLLSYTQSEKPNLRACNLDDLLKRHRSSFENYLTDGQTLKMICSSKSYQVYIDTEQIIRVISVLLDNANEATKNSEITLATEYVSVSSDALLSNLAPGEYVRVVVKDRGVGMDEETLKRCFEPFFSTKDIDESSGVSRTGAGLGLAVAYGLAKKNDGILLAESTDGKGSIFALYLPVFRGSKEELEDQSAISQKKKEQKFVARDRRRAQVVKHAQGKNRIYH